MCNCNKSRPRRPLSPKAKQDKGREESMTTKAQKFSLTTRDGRVRYFGSKLEANAENARAGYTGRVRPV